MRCASCKQEINPAPDGACPLCGFPAQQVNRKVTTIYITNSAIFFSTLVYAVLVYLMSTARTAQPTPVANTMFWLAVGLSVAGGVAMLVVNNITVKAALCELPAILGLCVFFLSGEVTKFVALLGISVALFVVLATHTPSYIKHIEQEAVQQWQQRGQEGRTW